MALPPLVSPEALIEQYPGLGTPEAVAGPLAAASALARSYTDRPTGWVDADGELLDVPDAVEQAVMLIARRVALMPPSGVSDETAGPFSVKRDSSMWLSTTEKILLDSAMNTANSITSLQLNGPVNDRGDGTVYLPVGDGTGKPIPWE